MKELVVMETYLSISCAHDNINSIHLMKFKLTILVFSPETERKKGVHIEITNGVKIVCKPTKNCCNMQVTCTFSFVETATHMQNIVQ